MSNPVSSNNTGQNAGMQQSGAGASNVGSGGDQNKNQQKGYSPRPAYGTHPFFYSIGNKVNQYGLAPAFKYHMWSAQKGPFVGALAWGIPAAGLGYLGAKLWNRSRDTAAEELSPEMVNTIAALSGLAAAGLGGYAGYNHTKKSSVWRAGELSKEDIIRIVELSSQLSSQEKMQAVSAIGQLSGSQLSQLRNILATAGGGAVGLLIFRWLMGKGLISSIAGAVIGGVIGQSLFGAPSYQPGTRTFENQRSIW
jgi:hypothetical protein